MVSIDHNRMIAQEAKAILTPLGMTRKGRSRTWLDDNSWWIGIVEFQPSAWSKGSYLNVAATWLWYPKDYLSFDYGPEGGSTRAESFHQFREAGSFLTDVQHLAGVAARAIQTIRSEFPSIEAVAQRLSATKPRSIWDHYHAAVANGIAGDVKTAKDHFAAVQREELDFPWTIELKEIAKQLSHTLDDRVGLIREVNSHIHSCRSLLKLKALNADAIEI